LKNFRTNICVLLVVLVGLAMNVSAAEHVLNPIADTFVRDGWNAEENYGTVESLELKWESDREGMTRIAFITFDISDISSVERAKLRLYVEWADQLEVRELAVWDMTGFEWSENELTWESAPSEGGSLITYLGVPNIPDIWYDVDVTSILKDHVEEGASTFTVRIENISDHWGGLVNITSREGANPSQLVIVD